MNLATGTVISQLPTGTIDNLNAVFPLTIGMPSSPQTIREPLQGFVDYLTVNGVFATGSFPNLSGYVTGSHTLLNGKYQPSGTMYFNMQFFLGNGSAVVSTGTVLAGYPYVEVPTNCFVDSWQVYADATGSITANILKSTAAGFPPSSPLAGLGQPILSGQRKNTGNPTGTVSLALGDILQTQISSAATVKLVTISLKCRKS